MFGYLHSIVNIVILPLFRESNCQECSLCKSRSSTKQDKCTVSKSREDKFFFTIYVHKDYSNMEVVVEATNLSEVICVTDDGCGGTIVSTGLDDGE